MCRREAWLKAKTLDLRFIKIFLKTKPFLSFINVILNNVNYAK